MKPIRVIFFAILACLLSLAVSASALAQDEEENRTTTGAAASYTTITGVTVTPLSNGVQITINADGILDYARRNNGDTKNLTIGFPGARNGTGKNFFNVNRYPVSHISLTTPQGAFTWLRSPRLRIRPR